MYGLVKNAATGFELTGDETLNNLVDRADQSEYELLKHKDYLDNIENKEKNKGALVGTLVGSAAGLGGGLFANKAKKVIAPLTALAGSCF